MDLVINLEYKPYVALYRRLSDGIRAAILEGRLKPGQDIPSVRDLSLSLNVSRTTVLKAFDDLITQGYLKTASGSGTTVAENLPGDLCDLMPVRQLPNKRDVELSTYGQRLMELSHQDHLAAYLPQINYAGPTLAITPLTQWKQVLLKHCQLEELASYGETVEPFGLLSLREALDGYLNKTRQAQCSPARVVVTGSKQFRIDLLARILLNPGDYVAFEEPGYPVARQALASYGAQIVPIPVDNKGLNVDYLVSLPHDFKFVYVQPAHHDPTGATLSLARRYQLLKWAKQKGVFILEDDWDNEYRYGGESLPSLQGLDDGDRVIYFSSLWKVFLNILPMGYMILPKCLIQLVWLAKMNVERHLPILEQLALTSFINDGHLRRYIRKTQAVYARHRQALIYALTLHFGKQAEIAKESGGTHILVRLTSDLPDLDVSRIGNECGVPIISTAPYYMGEPRKGEFIITFANIDEHTIGSSVRQWAHLLKNH
jgi:GntR family transcriptional regulator/MocR family aminotransferase